MSSFASGPHSSKVCCGCKSILNRTVYSCSICPHIDFCTDCIDEYECEIDNNDHPLTLLHPYNSHIFLRLPVDRAISCSTKLCHDGIKCAYCPSNCGCITGFRYFCTTCAVSLCGSCELLGLHQLDHNLLKMAPPGATKSADVSKSGVASEMSGMRFSESGSTTSESSEDYPAEVGSSDDDILHNTRISYNTLKAMLRRENELRLSPAVQEQYRDRGYDAYVDITEALQRQVATEFNLDVTEGVDYLQLAETLVRPNKTRVEEVRSLSLYRKYNRCYDGSLQVGDVAPMLANPLYLLKPGTDKNQDLQSTTLLNDYLSQTVRGLVTPELLLCPLVLICGSYS